MEDIIAKLKAMDKSVVTLYSDRVVIDRSQAFHINLSGSRGIEVNPLGKSIRTIPLDSIKVIVFNEAVKKFIVINSGILDFVVTDGTMENRILFDVNENSTARKIKDYIEEYLKNAPKSATTIVQQASAADELKKFKELLDMGVISQGEFDSKKKQLLGL